MSYYYSGNRGSNTPYILIFLAVLGLVAGYYYNKNSEFREKVKSFFSGDKEAGKNITITFFVETDTGYRLQKNEALVTVFGNKTISVKENNKTVKKVVWGEIYKDYLGNEGGFSVTLKTLANYEIKIEPAFSFVRFYPTTIKYIPYNKTTDVLKVEEQAELRPINLRLEGKLVEHVLVLDKDKPYTFTFTLRTKGEGKVKCPTVEFKGNFKPYINMWVKAGDMLNLPEKVELNTPYELKSYLDKTSYSDVVLEVDSLDKAGTLVMKVKDCYENLYEEYQINFE